MSERVRFHGSALAAAGRIIQPTAETIDALAVAALPSIGGQSSSESPGFVHTLFRFDRAHAQATGLLCDCDEAKNSASKHLQVTIEGLNILNIIKADIVVANFSATYPAPADGSPEVSIFGTHFENLRIAGIPITVEIGEYGARVAVPEKSELRADGNLIRVPGVGTVRLAEINRAGKSGRVKMIHVDFHCPHKAQLEFCCIDGGPDLGPG